MLPIKADFTSRLEKKVEFSISYSEIENVEVTESVWYAYKQFIRNEKLA